MARKKKAEEPSAGAPWLNTFADLMNLLLCFFVLLFASSNVDAEKYEQIVSSFSGNFSIFSSGPSTEGKQLISVGINQLDNYDAYSNTMTQSSDESLVEYDVTQELIKRKKEASLNMYDKVTDLTDQYNLGDSLEVSIDPNYQYIQLSLSGSILFDSGQADIKKEALPIFSKVGDILQVYQDYQIGIEGHTDNIPIHNKNYSSNNWLSSARALNAAIYLIEDKGLNPQTLSWTGRGEYDPVASNSTEDGRAKNRRVEIKIFNDINN